MNLWRKPKLFKNLDYLVPEFFLCFVFFLVFNPQSHGVETSSEGKDSFLDIGNDFQQRE